jgi:hypothetical protein
LKEPRATFVVLGTLAWKRRRILEGSVPVTGPVDRSRTDLAGVFVGAGFT